MAILLTDDSKLVRSVLKGILKRLGVEEVRECGNGREAIEALRASSFDAVLLDINMPVMDGFECLSAMRADEKLKSLPVIIISSVHDRGLIDKALSGGANGYVVKPFQADTLAATLDNVLGKGWRKEVPLTTGR